MIIVIVIIVIYSISDFWSKVIIMVRIIFNLIKRFYNCNISEIMVSMGIYECIFVVVFI